MYRNIQIVVIGLFIFFGCKNTTETPLPVKEEKKEIKVEVEVEKEVAITYKLLLTKDSIKRFVKNTDSNSLKIIAAVNRADAKFLKRFDSIIIPSDLTKPIKYYFPFPLNVSFLKNIKKIIFFSYPTQSFAAYENGQLVYTGPTSMGRKANKTPTGLFYTNWKSKESISTFNDEWKLKWNFNIENKLGVGFHQYEMPGYPASHSCLRLTEMDAKYLYQWADQWKLQDAYNISAYGTAVIVFGKYTFGSSKPWLALASNENALNITEGELENIANQYLPDIVQKQQQRDSLK